ncbi:S-methyl-5-thioribose-1-phosphate isomerase [Rhodobacteraceae bacterium]|nr:S-methyl-5-thioribose-1-phosphate isomerase [Paracoccaceae bacterium]
MKVGDTHYRSIWYDTAKDAVQIIDQRWLPHDFRITALETLDDFATAIRDMWVRGAPLIGATAAYGIAREMRRDRSDAHLQTACDTLNATRPTAINLGWALGRCQTALKDVAEADRAKVALQLAQDICDEDVEMNRQIGLNGLQIIRDIAARKDGAPVNILTHCNAGWIATVDWGTATSPMYHAANANLPIHVWIDETRPRNQGALTAWELGAHGISHAYITDNAGGHLMQHGHVDLVITGTDRTTRAGDVCNKIGTYLKALAAHDNNVPFYVALPSPTIDWTVSDGLADIPIEARPASEVTHIQGTARNGQISEVRVTPEGTRGENPAFDVTPARLITGLVTERGITSATPEGLTALFPDLSQNGAL